MATVADRARRRARARGEWLGGWWRAAARRPSPHFNERPVGQPVWLAVIHSISLPPGRCGGDAIEQLFAGTLDCDRHPYFAGLRGLKVSAHFLVRRGGGVLQFVPADRRAWHAGPSFWGGQENCNNFSVGIELEGLEGGRFERPQYRQLARLLRAVSRRFPLREAAGHQHVAPGRKADPGSGFDWALLAQHLRGSGIRIPDDVWAGGASPTR